MKKIYIFCFVLFVFGFMSCAVHNQKNTKNSEISFYRVINKVGNDDLRINNLSGVVLADSPIFTSKDIIEYSQNEHTIKLTKEAYKNFRTLPIYNHFVICIDNQPVYLGMVYGPDYWSAVPTGFLVEAAGCNEIKLRYDHKYLDGTKKEGYDDPGQNKLILDSLRRSNKLVETISEEKALEIARRLFYLEFNYRSHEKYKFSIIKECEIWSIFYMSRQEFNCYGEISVDRKTGEAKHAWFVDNKDESLSPLSITDNPKIEDFTLEEITAASEKVEAELQEIEMDMCLLKPDDLVRMNEHQMSELQKIFPDMDISVPCGDGGLCSIRIYHPDNPPPCYWSTCDEVTSSDL